jgi:ribonuclease E
MAVLESGKLVEYNIQMSAREPITGNIYKAVVSQGRAGLQAAFVDYGAKKHAFCPPRREPRVLPQRRGRGGGPPAPPAAPEKRPGDPRAVARDEKDHKGAMLTTYISLPGRYVVLMPNRQSTGISRKIDDDESRKNLMELMEQISPRTGGVHRPPRRG